MNKNWCYKCGCEIPEEKFICDECWKKRVEEGYKNGKDGGDQCLISILLVNTAVKKIYTDGIRYGNNDLYVFPVKKRCMQDTRCGWIRYQIIGGLKTNGNYPNDWGLNACSSKCTLCESNRRLRADYAAGLSVVPSH